MAADRLQAGVAEREVTGRAGLMLSTELRPVRSTGVRSPLRATALVLSDGAETLAVALDLFGIARQNAEQAVDLLRRLHGRRRGP
jgi:hypothetical protein